MQFDRDRYWFNESIPWSNADLNGFLWACLGSGLLLTLVSAVTANLLTPVNLFHVFLFGFLVPMLLNAPVFPWKHWQVRFQYLLCVAVSMIGVHLDVAMREGLFMWLIAHFVVGGLVFLTFRVNWWFLWDNPSRRTGMEKTVLSIFYTGIPVLGFGMGFWRLLGAGVKKPTTVFQPTPVGFVAGPVVEMVPDDIDLVDQAERVRAVRKHTRVNAGDKNAISETI